GVSHVRCESGSITLGVHDPEAVLLEDAVPGGVRRYLLVVVPAEARSQGLGDLRSCSYGSVTSERIRVHLLRTGQRTRADGELTLGAECLHQVGRVRGNEATGANDRIGSRLRVRRRVLSDHVHRAESGESASILVHKDAHRPTSTPELQGLPILVESATGLVESLSDSRCALVKERGVQLVQNLIVLLEELVEALQVQRCVVVDGLSRVDRAIHAATVVEGRLVCRNGPHLLIAVHHLDGQVFAVLRALYELDGAVTARHSLC